MSEWRPIETAPTNGNPFHAASDGVYCGIYRAHHGSFMPEMEILLFKLTGQAHYKTATHWFPVWTDNFPEPPK